MIELKRLAVDADRALQVFRKAHNLADDGISTQDSASLSNLKTQLAKATAALEKHRKDIEDLQATGKISSSGLVYPGAKLIIKDVELSIIREYNSVTFVRDGNLIRSVKYEEIEEEEINQR